MSYKTCIAVTVMLFVVNAATSQDLDDCDMPPRIFDGEGFAHEGLSRPAIGDFDMDGDQDIASLNQHTGEVSFRLNCGNATFDELTIPGFNYQAEMFSLDLDNDGDPDLVFGGENITIRRNHGTGLEFGLPEIVEIGDWPTVAHATDLNNDNLIDLILSDLNGFHILINDDDGGFIPSGTYSAGDSYRFEFDSADIDKDGDIDLAVFCSISQKIWVFRNDGGAQFTADNVQYTAPNIVGMMLREASDDSFVDLISFGAAPDRMYVYENFHTGIFDAPQSWNLPVTPLRAVAPCKVSNAIDTILITTVDDAGYSLHTLNWSPMKGVTEISVANDAAAFLPSRLADLDGDGDLDLCGGLRSTFLNLGQWRFRGPQKISVGERPWGQCVGDFDNDSHLDIAVANWQDGGLSLLKNTGGGFFAPAQTLAPDARLTSVVSCKINDDSFDDLVALDWNENTAWVFLSNGPMQFAAPIALPTSDDPRIICRARINGDDFDDLIILCRSSQTIDIYSGSLDGALSRERSISLTTYPTDISILDSNSDGLDEFAISMFYNELHFFENDGRGNIRLTQIFPLRSFGRWMTTTDIEQDGDLDVVLLQDQSTQICINNGGTFLAPEFLLEHVDYSDLLFADLDGNGASDLVTAQDGLQVRMRRQDGTFYPHRIYGESQPRSAITAADMDNDGDLDVIAASREHDTVTVFLNRIIDSTCRGDFAPDQIIDSQDLNILLQSWGPCAGCPMDLNNDNLVDTTDLLELLDLWGPC